MTTEYKITPGGRIYKDGSEVLQDDREPAYLAYASWLAKGNGPDMIGEIEAADTPADDAAEREAIEAELTKLEKRIALLRERTATKEETR